MIDKMKNNILVIILAFFMTACQNLDLNPLSSGWQLVFK